MSVSTTAFREMQKWFGLPGDGESGLKLVRRSIANIARQRLGEALNVTDEIFEAIEKLTPGAFGPVHVPNGTGATPE